MLNDYLFQAPFSVRIIGVQLNHNIHHEYKLHRFRLVNMEDIIP